MHLFPLAVVALLGWGALAFGSEYSWAYAPLLVFSVVVAVLGLLASPGGRFPARALGVALAVVLAGVLMQLTPLPQSVVRAVAPASMGADYAQLYAKVTMAPVEAAKAPAEGASRTLSISPSRTVLGLAFLVALMLLFVGCVRGLSRVGAHGMARGILMLGVVVALADLLQRFLASTTVYGFWYPPKGGVQLVAPFINHNHTAGWLVMAWALSAGYFAGAIANGLRDTKPDWRHRILWLSSRDASETLLAGFAVGAMAISIVATASRSGALCLALVILAFAWRALRRQPTGYRKAVATISIVVVLVAAVSLGGVEILAGRLQEARWGNLDGRVNVWKDTARIIRDFPWTGTGWNTYGIAMLHYQTYQDGSQYIEAHNDYLQLLSEGGVLVCLPILMALLLFGREVWRRFREEADRTMTYWLRAGAVTGLCAIAVQSTMDFTLQMPGAAVLFVVLAAIAIHRPDHVRGTVEHPVR